VSVAAVEGWRVCYLDRGAGPSVAGVIPEDDCVRQAAALGEATVIAFPDSAASRAFRELAEVIAGEA
jgi:MinD-like ATPase involved in chromosome partitioning or flagellar assembly